MSRRVLLACLIGCLGFLAFAADPKPGESPEGVLPAGADGKPLNLDFETGTLKGKEIFIRLVDKHAGGWGHVNFDDFRFHTEKPKFAPRQQAVASAADVYKFAGLPPDKSAEAMTVPEGFTVQLFAGEPDVTQP